MSHIKEYNLKLLLLGALFCLWASISALAQQYTFTHYDIEDGLIQSQVNSICQDNKHRLWVGTLGGACRFDGSNYYTIARTNGLINNFVYKVFCDSKGNTWLGTHKGLVCLRGQQLHNYTVSGNPKATWISHIIEDGAGVVWVIVANDLFRVDGSKLVAVKLPGTPSAISALTIDYAGRLYAFKQNAGLYRLNADKWQLIAPPPTETPDIFVNRIIFSKKEREKAYLLAYRGVYTCEHNSITPYAEQALQKLPRPILCMDFDAGGDLWLGTNSGVYVLRGNQVMHFGVDNGFTDKSVSEIYRDSDDNLWLGTQGGGVYKYDGDEYILYNNTDGLSGYPIVMGITQDKQHRALLGSDGGGLISFDGKDTRLLWRDKRPYGSKIESIMTDKDGVVWIGTSLSGIWRYDGKKCSMINGTENNTVNTINQSADGTVWLGTAHGLYYYEHGNIFKQADVNGFISSIAMLGKDSIMLGCQEGVQLLVKRRLVPVFKLKALSNMAALCLFVYGNQILIGTDDNGIFIWDRLSGQVKNYQVRDGLKSNSIYSLAVDSSGLFWAGTGRGVNKFWYTPHDMQIRLLRNAEPRGQISESNQNAILFYKGKMLVGTTKGLAVYNTGLSQKITGKPYILINAIDIYRSGNVRSMQIDPEGLSGSLKLNYNQNHIDINFRGVYLKNPQNVLYQYRLIGLDDKFCAPLKNERVDYPSLPPGHYSFEVRAITADGETSANTARFNFEITPPFYRTYIFELGVILALILIGVLLQNYFHRLKILRQLEIEKMKREEQLKIRQQTAEDFHDDLGNKLTRITVLSDILDAKLSADSTDQRNLVMQIKQNASALYNGTRDILWAMDPRSDNLFEVFMHIKEIGVELFQDVPVVFETGQINAGLEAVKLPMEYSRNITMIFKELLTNVLKHADAQRVSFTCQVWRHEVKLRITDDGAGFETEAAGRGYGLNNVRARAERIGAELKITTAKAKGTTVDLLFTINKV